MSASSIASRALDQGKGILRLAPNWVPRVVLRAREEDQAPSRGLLRVRRGPGRDRRALVLLHHARRQRAEDQPERGPELHRRRGRRPDGEGHPSRRHCRAEGQDHRRAHLDEAPGVADVSPSSSTTRAPSPTTCTSATSTPSWSGMIGKPEVVLLSRPEQQLRRRLSRTRSSVCSPGTTKDQVRECLRNFTKGDNKITNLSSAYRLEPGTGWDVPAGILHAPGSLCTYEPQKASDVFSMWQSLTGDAIIPEELLWKNSPAEKVGNIEFLMELIDWDANVDPNFAANHFMRSATRCGPWRRWRRRATTRTGSPTSPPNTAPRSSPSFRGRRSPSRTAAATA